MSLTKVSYSMIQGGPYSVLDFGADPTGAEDSATAFQDAIDYIVDTGVPGVLQVPTGTYKLDSGITVNCGYVSVIGDRAKLDFSGIGDVAAITFIGGNLIVGNPWNQADFVFQGIVVSGPGNTTGTGFYLNELNGSNLSGPAHTKFKDFKIENFKTGIYFGNHAYLCFFDHFDIWNATTGIWFPINDLAGNAITDSGENIAFYNGTIYGTSLYDFYCENTLSYSDFEFVACSFDGSGDAQVYNNTGVLTFTGCHFEGSADRAIYVNNAASVVTVTGGYMIDNGNKSLTGYIYNTGYMSIYGTRIASYTRNGIVYSNSRLTCFGAHFQTDQAESGQIQATDSANYWIPNIGKQTINGTLDADVVIGSTISGSGQVITCSVTNTWYSLGTGNSNGMYLFRDTTSGGVSMFIADSTIGAVTVSNNITGLEMRYSTQMEIRVTSGTVPRNIAMTFVRVTT